MKLKDNYQQQVKKLQPKPSYFLNCVKAFLIGGLICVLGQALYNFYVYVFDISPDLVQQLVLVTLIALTAILTGLGVYDKIGQFAGAGAILPITGFANSLTSAALEHRSEGLVAGVGNNMFKVAGAVIVYGVVIAYVLGFVRYLF